MKKSEVGSAHVIIIVVIVVAIVGVLGVTFYTTLTKQSTVANSTDTTALAPIDDTLPSDLLPIDQVSDIALESSTDTSLNAVNLTIEDGIYVYEIHLSNGKTLYINAQTGKIITKEATVKDESETDTSEKPVKVAPSISFEDARKKAISLHSSSQVTKINLETEDGKLVFSVRFADKFRVDIDAVSGEVVRTKAAEKDKGPEQKKPASSSEQSSTKTEQESHDDHHSSSQTSTSTPPKTESPSPSTQPESHESESEHNESSSSSSEEKSGESSNSGKGSSKDKK